LFYINDRAFNGTVPYNQAATALRVGKVENTGRLILYRANKNLNARLNINIEW